MRLFIDTDILLDVALRREPHFEASKTIVDWAESNPGKAAVSWHGLANLNYILKGSADQLINALLEFVEIPRTGSEHMKYAISLNFKDLEDAMQVASGHLFNAQVIVTRNIKDYSKSPIKAMTPEQYIKLL